MRYLGLALFAEGPTDHRFLGSVLNRLCTEICQSHGRAPVDIGEVLELHSLPGSQQQSRAERISAAAREAATAWHILFIHADADADAKAARQQRVQPAMDKLMATGEFSAHDIVAVIPVRMTDAWMLADPDALRKALHLVENLDLELPTRTRELERLTEPKAQLQQITRRSSTRKRQRRRRDPLDSLPRQLGNSISLDCLRRLPAFQIMERELRQSLAHLGYLHPDAP